MTIVPGFHAVYTVIQPEALEDAAVGIEHVLVGGLQAFFIQMEGVGVFHQEFASAHHAETRADFVAEFALDLEEVDGQLFVRAQVAAHQIGNHFFVRRPQAVVALVAVLDAQQLRPVLLPAPRFLPQFGGQY